MHRNANENDSQYDLGRINDRLDVCQFPVFLPGICYAPTGKVNQAALKQEIEDFVVTGQYQARFEDST